MKRFLQMGKAWAPFSSFLAPALAFAQGSSVVGGGAENLPPPSFTSPSQVLQVLCDIAGWMFVFLIALAIIFVIVAAFKYMTSGGDQEKVKEANKALVFAAVAVAVGIFARSVPLIVSGLISSASVSAC